MSDDSDFQYYDEDEGVDDTKHDKIVENILHLNKSEHLKKPSRTEPSLQISEFNLVKSVSGGHDLIDIENLTKALSSRKRHLDITKRIEATKKRTHTLPKPLEKPQSQRIQRSVGYEKNRFLFDRWEAFVTSNRATAHQSFPLGKIEKLKVQAKDAERFPSTWTYKSELEKRLEKLEPKIEEYHIEDEEDKNDLPLTLEEMKERRKEAAKLRAHQSYKEAKARRQNKIKSKKYHRILRKEMIKEKLKQFEELQKTDPEAALKKLDEIEKARALERFSLRHKSTGQWAKSKQVRAKYDKESRQVLAQQLHISRELTQKQKVISDSEDEGFVAEETVNPTIANTSDNPWIGKTKPDQEVSDFLSEYKKYWTETNNRNQSSKNKEDSKPEATKPKAISTTIIGKKIVTQNCKDNKMPKKQLSNKTKLKKEKKIILQKKNQTNQSGDWDIEEIFIKAENKLTTKLQKKLTAKTPKEKKKKLKKMKSKSGKEIKKTDLTMPAQKKKQIIDEAMIEQPFNVTQEPDPNAPLTVLKNFLTADISSPAAQSSSEGIVAENFKKPKITNLSSVQPDLIMEYENTDENDQANVIMEALEDDDISAEFAKEKQSEVEKDKPRDIDLNLPGWGSWAGSGINPKKQRKRRRFIVKMPEVLPRRDDNKGLLIINEKAAAKVKPHLVSEVPFPFRTVKNFEASIRAPISNTFVPEKAFRRFIKPAVTTKMGTIIEPAHISHLMGGISNK
ncbi:U3 small nucleolar RNA-associated protein 14 homolog A [Euwallacea similis]|uniref:U3 small nucleolar RNA-associated protein 14 homolog A n=1 Tax=Euwallacea similis TaxID=1736056 RepID=UPI00344B94FD